MSASARSGAVPPVEGGSGAKTWSPTSVAQVQRNYHGAYGTSTIDLAAVPFTSGTWTINATQGVGVLTIDVPRDAVVSIRSHVGIGNVDTYTLDEFHISPLASRSSTVPVKDAPHLDLNLQAGIGQINVVRQGVTTPPAPPTPKTPKTPKLPAKP